MQSRAKVSVWPTPAPSHAKIRLGPSHVPRGTSWEMTGVRRASQPDIRHEHAARSSRGRHPKVLQHACDAARAVGERSPIIRERLILAIHDNGNLCHVAKAELPPQCRRRGRRRPTPIASSFIPGTLGDVSSHKPAALSRPPRCHHPQEPLNICFETIRWPDLNHQKMCHNLAKRGPCYWFAVRISSRP